MIPPKVSVLIPVFNGGRYLAECLASIVAQDFRGLEILIADDGSTDDSLEVIRNFAARDARIRWWKNERNLGLAGNSNACLREARGEYVKFVHQDDLLLSASAIGKFVDALDKNPSAVMAGCRQHLTGTKSRPLMFSKKSGLFDGRRLIVTSLEQNGNLPGQPTLILFRRNAAKRGFDERFVGLWDFEMWCHLLENGDFFYIAEALATWRVHQSQQTAKQGKTGEAKHEQLQFIETYYAKPWLKKAATPGMLFTQIYYLNKYYGRGAAHLTAAMRSQLTSLDYAGQWLRHKVSQPLRKLGRKAGWTN